MILGLIFSVSSLAQTVIVTDDPAYTTGQSSAALDVKSITKGFLLPRMTQAQRVAITSPAEGLLVFQTDGVKGLYYYINSAWTVISSGAAGPWSLTGNSGTNSYFNFLGTTDNTTLRIRTNNTEKMTIDSMGNVGIGTLTPTRKLEVNGAITSIATTYPNYEYNSAFRMAFGESNVPANETGSVVQFGSGSNTRNMLFAFTKTNVNTSFFGNDGNQMMLGSESTAPITFRTGLSYTATNIIASGIEMMRVTSTGVGIGVTNPANRLVVKDTLEIRHVAGVSELLFTNTSGTGTGDFRIAGDGVDLFWQGGGGRALQMGSYHATILGGDRQINTFPAYIDGTTLTNTGVLVKAQRDASVALAIQPNSASQTANITEWRDATGTVMAAVSPSGQLGIATTATAKLDVGGTFKLGASGTVLNNIIKTSVAITDNTNITYTVSLTKTATVTGATTNATVIVNPRTALPNGVGIAWARVSASNTVQINFTNTGAGVFGNQVLGTITFDITVIE